MLEITVACIIILKIKLSLYFPVEIDKYYQVLSNAVKLKIKWQRMVNGCKWGVFGNKDCSLTGAHWFQSSLNQDIGIILKLNGSRFSLWKQENVSDSGNQCSSKIYSCQCISSSFCCRQCNLQDALIVHYLRKNLLDFLDFHGIELRIVFMKDA